MGWLKDLGRGPKWFLAGVAVVLLLGGGFWFMRRQLVKERAARAHAELQLKELLGRIAVAVPQRDTVYVHDTVPTVWLPDSTRIGSVRDSGFAGIIDVTATAPPWPAPLGIRIGVSRPAFTPTVGFVELGDSVVAIINWQGERVQVGTGYRRPKATVYRPAVVSAFVDGRYAYGNAVRIAGGAAVSLKSWSVFGGVEQDVRFQDAVRKPTWFVGAQRSFKLF